MYLVKGLLGIALIFATFLHNGGAYMIGNNPYNRAEALDPEGKYQLEWLVDWNSKRVTFNVSVETKGFVSFGLGSDGSAGVGDVVIGGVKSNGRAYFSDRHSVGAHLPAVLDQRQDWTLHSASESATHTFLCFSRAFDTCDPHDYPISSNKISLVWSYGNEDTERSYVSTKNRGFREVYLLDPDYTPRITRSPPVTGQPQVDPRQNPDVKIWTIPHCLSIPSNETSYICTMRKAPRLTRKHHMIGMNTLFETEDSRRYVHHLLIYRCTPPRNVLPITFFDSHVGEQQTCYSLGAPSGPIPTQFCGELYGGYGVGMRTFFMPPQVGSPLGESEDEYYLIQTHYNNPNQLAKVEVTLRLELYYTSILRAHEGGGFSVGHANPALPPSVMIPPRSTNHRIFGHCGGDCTSRMLPPEGITVFAGLLHTHNAGRRMRLHHFRNDQELPWVLSDDNYNFDYQQLRALREGRRVLPGDQLTMNCVYDTSGNNGTTVGGYGTRQEMCLAFIFVYNRLTNYTALCRSEINSPEYRQRLLGVGNVTWVEDKLEYVVDSPRPLQGLTVKEVADNHVNWSKDRREELQTFQLLHPQLGSCTRHAHLWRGDPEDNFTSVVRYPYRAKEYREPARQCSRGRGTKG